MGTKVSVIYEKPSMTVKEDFEEPFYCKETPFEVLKFLFPKYHIKEYNNLKTKWATLHHIDAKSESPGIQIGNPIQIDGLSVQYFDPKKSGLEISGSVKNYNQEILMDDIYVKKGPEFLNEFVREYLITTKVIDSGYGVVNWQGRLTIHKSGKQKAIEYVKERETKINDEKEKNLEDILDYGRVVLGEEFNLKKLKKISRKIAKTIPKKIEPIHIDYHTLKPSSHQNIFLR